MSEKEMMIEEGILWVDEDYQPIVSPQEAEEMTPIMADFVKEVGEAGEGAALQSCLEQKMKSYLPETSDMEIKKIAEDIIRTVNVVEENKKTLDWYKREGGTRERWILKQLTNATSDMTTQQSTQYCKALDTAIRDANEKMLQTVTTRSGAINKNPCLDGYIAEQHHADTFNLKAQEAGSPYRAEVLKPDGKVYNKNGVDIVIKDIRTNKTVKRYQSKYCQDSNATAKAFENGDYRGQQKLIPEDQAIGKKHTTTIEAPDGTKSEPLSKAAAKQMQEEAQKNQKAPAYDWNKFDIKNVAKGIADETVKAGCMGAGIAAGAAILDEIVSNKEIEPSRVAEAAVKGGADASVKAALAGALKVGAEKNIIKAIPKGTPAATLAAVATVAVENAKILYEAATERIAPSEAVEKMVDTTASTVMGIAASVKGAEIGAAIGTVFGPVGTAVGSVAGGIIGGMAGSAVGKTIANVGKKVVNVAGKALETIGEGLKKAGGFFQKVFTANKDTVTN